MRLIALATFRRKDRSQIVHQGAQFEVTDPYGRELVKNSLAVPTLGAEEAAGTASKGPPIGGPTGEERPVLSSDPAPVRKRRTSSSSEEESKPEPEIESEPSPSTTRGRSRRGRKSSTAATPSGGKRTRAPRSSKGSRSRKTSK